MNVCLSRSVPRMLLIVAALFLPLQVVAVDSWCQVVGNAVMPLGDGFGTNGLVNTGNKCVDALTGFNGYLYAAVGQNGAGSGNSPSVWRTGDLLHWTAVTSGGFPGNDLCIDANSNGIFLGTGYKSAMGQGQVWKSSNGLNWASFTGGGSGYNPTNNFLVLPGLQGTMLYAATANPTGGQVWERPMNGSTTWTKVLDFNSGFGTTDGPQTNLCSTCLYCPPSATNVMFYATYGGQWSALYESADGGASWQKNVAVANSFGTNSSEISALAEFNGFLYVGSLAAQGGCLWRTPLANATNWSSTAAWQQVVSGGFGTNSDGELHRIVAAYGNLWVCLAGPNAQVWRSADGTNWAPSNISGFATNNNAQGGYQALAAFTNTDGNAFMVWGGPCANPTNSSTYAAQVWDTQIAVAMAPAITAQPQTVSTNVGASASFTVGATGSPPFSYQWQMNATNILSATNATLVLNNVQPSDAGGYDVIVSNTAGSVTSLVAMLSVSPVIDTNAPPMPGIAGTNYSQTLSARAGAPPYAWSLVAGALPDGLTLSSAGLISGTPTAAGPFNFTVQLTDALGQIVTGAFSMAITDPWFQVVGNSIAPLGDGFGAGGVMNTSNTMIQSLTAYNGFLYAGVETVAYRPSIWRSSDMLNWTNIPVNAPPDFHNIFDMQANSNGIFFGTGYGAFPSGAQIWKSTNGLAWSVFSTPANGFPTNYVNPVYVSLQGNVLYAAPGSATSCQVWRRPADGSANWTELLDFNTGFGSADGVRTNMGISYIYCPPGATHAVFIPCGDGASSNCLLYLSADGGATWHLNAGAGNGFGDTNNGYIASVIEFNGYLYAGTGGANGSGAQIWRTPLATATNWSSTNAWQQVVGGGFGYPSTECHRFAVAGGRLWTFLFTHTSLKAKVWRSDDGMNWVQSNMDDFGTDDNAWNGALGSFTGTNGASYMVWGGGWTSPTNSNVEVAQIWATPIAGVGPPAIIANSPPPSGVVGAGYSLALSASGGTPAYTWSLIGGALPDGLTLSSGGQISGTPAVSGLFTFSVLVTDAAGQSATSSFSITVADLWTKMVGNGTTIFDGFGGATNTPENQAVEWLQVFNGQLYAAVGQQESGTGNPVSIWRSSDLTNWTQVGAGTFSTNDTDIYSIVSDGTNLFAGTKAASGGANIYVSTNGGDWSLFDGASSGFARTGTFWASHLGVLNGNLFAGILTTNGSGQVRKHATDGSGNWSKVVDFSNGQGLPGRQAVPGINAMYFYAVSNTLFMPAGKFLYQSTDDAGTNWVKNAGVGTGFGDANNLNISSLVDFNGYLYAPTHNTSTGGQLWRTPLTNALANGALPWTKVVDSGFGQGPQFTELHHIAVGLGYLWISVQGPAAQVWRSADGTTWVQSNIDGFDSNNPVTSYKPVVATFNNSAVWGGASGTNATGSQVWATTPGQQTPTYWFGATAGLDGSVGGDTNGWYASGGSVTVTATPAVYYHFAGWTGDVPSVQIYSNPVTLLMNQPRSISAAFAVNQGTNYGTPYTWLAGYGFTNNMSAAELLTGSNGLPLWQSYVADLNPTNPGSLLFILAFTNSLGGRVNAAFNSSTGRLYGLQCNTNLLPGSGWFEVSGQTNIWGNGGLKVLSDTNTAAMRFYRVQVHVPQ